MTQHIILNINCEDCGQDYGIFCYCDKSYKKRIAQAKIELARDFKKEIMEYDLVSDKRFNQILKKHNIYEELQSEVQDD